MANYATSVLAKGQAVVTARNNAPEQRRKLPTVMELALKNQEYAIPDAGELRKSDLRPVEIYFQKNVAAGAAVAKVATHTGTFGDSGKVELTYVTHVETMSLPRKLAQNNVLSYQALFNNLYEQKWKNLRDRHDNSALAFLLANKLQLAAATINPQIASANPGTWNDVNFALEVDGLNASLFAQKAKSFMYARNYTGPEYDVIADLQSADRFEAAMQQGAGNSTNLGWQFANMNISKTQAQIDANYTKGQILILPSKMFAGMYWNDALNVSGVNAGENEVGTLGTKADPFGSGAVADISMYTGRADTSANLTGGSTQDIVDQWELSLTIAYALPPLSTAGESVLAQIAQG